MIIHRNNGHANHSTPEQRLEAMRRHHEQSRQLPVAPAHRGDAPPAPPTPPPPGAGDIIYGAAAIARFIFGMTEDAREAKRNRRRVFGLWAYYRDRGEDAGFFKLKGAVCLSKSKWGAFHGL
ncbi:MAG TPA: hypothetical protein VH640_01230 [Bryobacteraceae bacterium]